MNHAVNNFILMQYLDTIGKILQANNVLFSSRWENYNSAFSSEQTNTQLCSNAARRRLAFIQM